ncbi:MAG: 7-cyano-7-deazaguanine synthase QueC [Acidobacteria bacterium]|nr:7-cyano-7-deazaguanine synthase QueC [Acidobacteriota bacterium]
MTKAVCLVSGGLDSCVTAAMAAEKKLELAFFHASYGQLTERRELQAFSNIADYYAVEYRLVVDLRHLQRIGGSALTDPDIPLPEGALSREGIPITYVPFRNANMLSVATSWAEVLGARFIYMGAVEEDSSGYPDCRESFFRAFNQMVREGTRPETHIEIITPLIRLTKKQIVTEGMRLKAPFHLTWSCYKEEKIACGKCDSCLLRLRGFQQAGFTDPLPYREYPALKY